MRYCEKCAFNHSVYPTINLNEKEAKNYCAGCGVYLYSKASHIPFQNWRGNTADFIARCYVIGVAVMLIFFITWLATWTNFFFNAAAVMFVVLILPVFALGNR